MNCQCFTIGTLPLNTTADNLLHIQKPQRGSINARLPMQPVRLSAGPPSLIWIRIASGRHRIGNRSAAGQCGVLCTAVTIFSVPLSSLVKWKVVNGIVSCAPAVMCADTTMTR